MKPEVEHILRNVRFLEMMIIKIEKYHRDSRYTPYLIDDLSGLLNLLEAVDETWKTNFRTAWLDIEICYANALARGLDHLTETGEKIVKESVQELEMLVLEKLEELKKLVPEQDEEFF